MYVYREREKKRCVYYVSGKWCRSCPCNKALRNLREVTKEGEGVDFCEDFIHAKILESYYPWSLREIFPTCKTPP